MGLDDGACLREMGAAIDAFEKNDVNTLEELGNGIDDFDVHFAEVIGEFGDAVAADRKVGTARGKCGDDLAAGKIAGGFGVVENLDEGGDVGSIAADDADAKRFIVSGEGGKRANRKEAEKGDCAVVHARLYRRGRGAVVNCKTVTAESQFCHGGHTGKHSGGAGAD